MLASISGALRPVPPSGLGRSFGQAWLMVIVVCAGSATGCSGPQSVGAPRERGVSVALRKTDEGWQMSRNGTPYFIRGAGGEGPGELLAKLGGNSIRTWGVDDLQRKLDDAEKHGLSVAVGIWLGHERHGFNYGDLKQVAQQKEKVKEAVLRYKDHPAVLLWGLGNEMEGYGKGDNAAIWSAVNDLAALVKELDPHHPTMTTVAEIGGGRVRSIHRLCPAIDIVGINSYGGASSVAKRYRDAGGTKPYILTEFGPPGPWEVAKSPWDAPLEPSSTEKALSYRRAYQKGVADAKGLCLGSYAFLFGYKQEGTATWFGMLLPDGSKLGACDVMTAFWSGKPPSNGCPKIEQLTVEGSTQVDPGVEIKAKLVVSDPENDRLTVRWVLQADPVSNKVGGDAEAAPESFPESIVKATAQDAVVRLPSSGGAYRLFAYVYDGQGGAAVANVPLHSPNPTLVSPKAN